MRIDSSGFISFNGSGQTLNMNIPGSQRQQLELSGGLSNEFNFNNSSNTGTDTISFSDPDGDNAGKISYSHNTDSLAFITNSSEQMRINSQGDVLVAKTSQGLATTGIELSQDLLRVTKSSAAPVQINRQSSDGDILNFYKDTSQKGSVSITSSAVAYNTSSDYRLKEDLQDFAGLDMISKIPVYDFKWKADDNRSYGVMAHELEEVLPQAVNGEKDAEEMQSVDYSKIVPLLVKSIQELKKEIEILKNK